MWQQIQYLYADQKPLWIASGLILLLGLFGYGLPDLLRFNFGRVWAISTVCFRDAIRRKALWITPLAMIGVVIVYFLSAPDDETDAVRLIVKCCTFTSALVVTVIALITAATNLPREIENRVVFTIVTKPVTRLEIIVGKVLGFARVSGSILLLMALFTLAFLHVMEPTFQSSIQAKLNDATLPDGARLRLQSYHDRGLLVSNQVGRSDPLEMYADFPRAGQPRWMFGLSQAAIFDFEVPPEGADWFVPRTDKTQLPGTFGGVLCIPMPWKPIASATPELAGKAPVPFISVQILDEHDRALIEAEKVGVKGGQKLTDPAGNETVNISLSAEVMNRLSMVNKFRVMVTGQTDTELYGSFGVKDTNHPVTLISFDSSDATASHSTTATEFTMRGLDGRYGQQLRSKEGTSLQPIAIYEFHDQPIHAVDDKVRFQLTAGVERSSSDYDIEEETLLEVNVAPTTGDNRNAYKATVDVRPENGQTNYFSVPVKAVQGKERGDFMVYIYNKSPGHTVGLQTTSLQYIATEEWFSLNLFKAFFVLWLFSILTSITALVCSTFLSWPIAVVVTLIVLLSRWMASGLDLGAGIGAQVATEWTSDATTGQAVNSLVENLNLMLKKFVTGLPDLTPFGITEQLQLGQMIMLRDLVPPLVVVLVFGLPMIVLGYVVFRNKEVAP